MLLVPLNRVISGQVTTQKLNDQCSVVKEQEVQESGETVSTKNAQKAEVQESGEMPSAPLASDSASVQ